MADDVTVLGSETEFNGIMEFKTRLVVLGKFNGIIKASGSLEIEKSSTCKVDYIEADSVVVSGVVSGDIHARDRLEMKSGSKIRGNVETARLRICDNVEFEGAVSMLETPPAVDIFSVSGAEYKDFLRREMDSESSFAEPAAESGI